MIDFRTACNPHCKANHFLNYFCSQKGFFQDRMCYIVLKYTCSEETAAESVQLNLNASCSQTARIHLSAQWITALLRWLCESKNTLALSYVSLFNDIR